MHACVHACLCACMHVCMHACMHVCMLLCACMHLCMHASVHVCMYACAHALCACMYVCICASVYACTHACTHLVVRPREHIVICHIERREELQHVFAHQLPDDRQSQLGRTVGNVLTCTYRVGGYAYAYACTYTYRHCRRQCPYRRCQRRAGGAPARARTRDCSSRRAGRWTWAVHS